MPPRTRTLGAAAVAAVLALGTSLLASAPVAGAAQPKPLAVTDHCANQCADILPPGENGNATLVEILGNKAFGTHPAHSDDQLDRYNGLVAGHTGLTDQKLTDFFNDASFGVAANQVESVISPREDVTITRDRKSGVPHIKGTTRYGTEFGAGFAAGQDRLWLMDLFRHIGRGELTSFSRRSLANQGLEQQFWPQAPYTEADLEAQVERIRTTEGALGEQAMADAQAYVDGINAYRVKSKNGRYFPGEYVLTGKIDSITNIGEIQPFKLTDLISIASVVGGQFGGEGAARSRQRSRCSPPSRSTASRRAPGSGSPSASATTPRPSSPCTTAPRSRTRANPTTPAAPRCPTRAPSPPNPSSTTAPDRRAATGRHPSTP